MKISQSCLTYRLFMKAQNLDTGSISHGIIGLQRILVLLVLGVKRVDNLIFSPLVSTKTVPELSTSRCPTDQHKLLYKNPLNSGDT